MTESLALIDTLRAALAAGDQARATEMMPAIEAAAAEAGAVEDAKIVVGAVLMTAGHAAAAVDKLRGCTSLAGQQLLARPALRARDWPTAAEASAAVLKIDPTSDVADIATQAEAAMNTATGRAQRIAAEDGDEYEAFAPMCFGKNFVPPVRPSPLRRVRLQDATGPNTYVTSTIPRLKYA